MRRFLIVFLLSVWAITAFPLCARSARVVRPDEEARRPRFMTGTVKKIKPERIWITDQKRRIAAVYAFRVTGETVIEGNISVGKKVFVEYTIKVKRRADRRNATTKTALRISGVP